MKKIINYGMIVVLGLVLTSCSNSANEEIIGKWDDNIKLSQKTVNLSATENTITITTQSTYWWLNQILFNNKETDLTNIDKLAKNFVITNSEFKVERKEEGKKISITIHQNNTNAERTLVVGLQNGDYYDAIKIFQAK